MADFPDDTKTGRNSRGAARFVIVTNLPAISPRVENCLAGETIEKAKAVALVDADVLDMVRAARAENTVRAYTRAARSFTAWCTDKGVSPLPAEPETVAAFLVDRMKAGDKASTINVTLAGIRHLHRAAGFPSPTEHEAVKEVGRGIRCTIGTAPTQKQPATAERVAALLSHMASDMQGIRDRALIALGMAGAFRRSELVGLDVQDLVFTDRGVDVTIRKAKTDQEGRGALVAVPHGRSIEPVRLVNAWIEAAGLTEGPLFRPVNKSGRVGAGRVTDRSVADIIKGYATKAAWTRPSSAGIRSGPASSPVQPSAA